MTTANTGATPTGHMMTMEDAVASMSANLKDKGATVDALATKLDEDGVEVEETGEVSEVTAEQTEETDTEAVSTDESTEAKEEPDVRPVLLPDGSEITVEEARKGYLRQADFTRKTQDLAKEREQSFMQASKVMDEVKRTVESFQILTGSEPTPAQMIQLRQQDPEKYQEVKAYWDDANKVLAEGRQKLEAWQQAKRSRNQAKSFEALNSGTFEPAWKDQKALQTGLKTITEHLAERGYDQGFIDGVDNHLLIEDLEKARRYDELQKAKPKAVKSVQGKPKPFVPGSKTQASPQTETLRLVQERFNKNPSMENAFALEKAKQGLRR